MNTSMPITTGYDFSEVSLGDPEVSIPDAWLVQQQRSATSLGTDQLAADGSATTRLSAGRNVFQGYMLSTLVAAVFRGTSIRRVYQVRSDTVIVRIAWHLDEDYWEPTPQLITNEQVRALNALLATPYTNSHDFDYFADE